MIKKELTAFIVVGILTVLIDLAVYRGFVLFDLLQINGAKAMGFVAGMIFSYFSHKAWTFSHKHHKSGAAWRYVLLYASTLGVNVVVNAYALLIVNEFEYAVLLAFLLATGFSTVLNFIGMKYFVFKGKEVREDSF